MISDITLGQYFPQKSLLHSTDPRMKICLVIYAIVLLFMAGNFASLALAVAYIGVGMAFSKISLKLYLKSLKPILFLVVFTGVLNIFYGTGDPLVQFGMFKITLTGIFNCIFVSVRIIALILASSVLAAQKARGADMESGSLIQRIRALVPVLIPLFVSAFRRAFDLAVAMESRCYHGGDGRTKMKQVHFGKRDWCVLAFSLAVLALFGALNLLLPAVGR